jgi:hypothetical protein
VALRLQRLLLAYNGMEDKAMNIKTSIAILAATLFVTPLVADDNTDSPRRWRDNVYFVDDDDDRRGDWRDRLREERKWREEADKRARERAREWDKLQRERLKEWEQHERERRKAWDEFERERAEQFREAQERARDRWRRDWEYANERGEVWPRESGPWDTRRPPPALRYDPGRYPTEERWFEDDFDDDLHDFDPPYPERRWLGEPPFHDDLDFPQRHWHGYRPRFEDFHGWHGYDDDDDDDDNHDDD